MRSVLIAFFSFITFTIYCQPTLTEREVINDNKTLIRTLDFDLNLLKETYIDKQGEILEFYNYDPVTKQKTGEFFNGVYNGTFNKDGLITSSEYFQIINPKNKLSQSKMLYITGNIIEGKLDGKYSIYQRSFKERWVYDPQNTYINSSLTGFKEKVDTYRLFVDKNNFEDIIVGSITFQDGKYVEFEFKFEGERYYGDYKDGVLLNFQKDKIETNEIIDMYNVGGKVYMKNGKWFKLEYPEIIQHLEKFKESGSLVPKQRYYELQEKDMEILIVDPLNGRYGYWIQKKIMDEFGVTTLTISPSTGRPSEGIDNFYTYLKDDYKSIYFIPCCVPQPESTWMVVGFHPSSKNQGLSIPSNFNIVSRGNGYKPIFELELNLSTLVDKYGSKQGYYIYSLIIWSKNSYNKKWKFKDFTEIYPNTTMIEFK